MIRNTLPFATVPEWLLDADLSDRAVRLYAVLVRHADRGGHAHPSRRGLANRLRCSESSLDRAVKELVGCGALTVTNRPSHHGDWDVNDYELRPGGVTGEATGGVTGDEGNESPSEREESIESPSDSLPRRGTAFERFWKLYPLKVEKVGARAKFAAALRRGVNPEAIIAGAERYRDDPNREDGYTKHPTTWLNNGCWEDEPIKPRRSRDPRPRDIAGEHLAEALQLAELEGGGNDEGFAGEGLGRAARGGVDAHAGGQRRALPR